MAARHGGRPERGYIFNTFPVHAEGERRGPDRVGAQHLKGLGGDASLGTLRSSAFAVGMLRDIEKKNARRATTRSTTRSRARQRITTRPWRRSRSRAVYSDGLESYGLYSYGLGHGVAAGPVPYIVMTNIVMAYIVMACIVTACKVMAHTIIQLWPM